MYSKRSFTGKSVVLILIGINVGVYLLEMAMWNFTVGSFALIPILVTKKYFVWQIFTHMFLHGSILHLFFNMFALFIFGMPLENLWGSSKFLRYYIVAGLGGGLLHYLINPMSAIPSLGASGAVYGILLAYGLTFPEDILYLNFFIPIKAKYAVWIFGATELLFGVANIQSGVAHFAHLGGLITGFIYLKSDAIFSRAAGRIKSSKVYKNYDDMMSDKKKMRLDQLLSKISSGGYNALNEEEKYELDELSKWFRDMRQ